MDRAQVLVALSSLDTTLLATAAAWEQLSAEEAIAYAELEKQFLPARQALQDEDAYMASEALEELDAHQHPAYAALDERFGPRRDALMEADGQAYFLSHVFFHAGQPLHVDVFDSHGSLTEVTSFAAPGIPARQVSFHLTPANAYLNITFGDGLMRCYRFDSLDSAHYAALDYAALGLLPSAPQISAISAQALLASAQQEAIPF